MQTVSRAQRFLTNQINSIEDMAIKYSIDTTLKHFGKQFYFGVDNSSGVIEEIVMKFIKKYDKKFDQHAQKSTSDKPYLMNVNFYVHLEKGTFMYVATGNKIGNTEERYLMSSNISSIDTFIYIFGKKMRKYVKELEKLVESYLRNDELGLFNVNSERSYNGRGYGNEGGPTYESLEIVYSKLSTRELDTMFFSCGEKEKITQHIQRFLDNEEFYSKKQILFKTGILLYGKPGTGKSSLVKALATTYNRSIVNINVSNLATIDLNKLTSSINVDENRKYIVLLEDVDTLFLSRANKEVDKNDNAIINKLLQFLDSNSSPTNVIFIATTNHLERLDEALLREGRFDLKVEVCPLLKKEAVEFGLSFGLDKQTILSICNDLDKETENSGVYNQSSLQARILSKLTNKSLEQVKSVYCETEEEINDQTENTDITEENEVEEDV